MLLSVPHSGRDYPDWLVDSASAGRPRLRCSRIHSSTGWCGGRSSAAAGRSIARTPRAAIDCNRAEDDVDPSVIDGARSGRLTARARGGLGIVPSRTQQHGYLWRRPITPVQLVERLDQAHRPYHAAIDEQLSLLLDRFGCALLIDCHSMPPPPGGTPPIVFGDCRGRTADSWVGRDAVEIARSCGLQPRSTIRSRAAM